MKERLRSMFDGARLFVLAFENASSNGVWAALGFLFATIVVVSAGRALAHAAITLVSGLF